MWEEKEEGRKGWEGKGRKDVRGEGDGGRGVREERGMEGGK